MTWQRQTLFWSGVFAALLLVLYVLGPILLPFVVGLALAYALDPLADRLERLGLGRLAATLTILLLFTAGFIALLVILVPVIVQQVIQFLDRIPDYVARLNELYRDFGDRVRSETWLGDLLGFDPDTAVSDDAISDAVRGLAGRAADWTGQLVQGLATGGAAFISLMALLVVTPVVTFFLLNDWDRLVARVDSWVPRDHVHTVRRLAREIDAALAGFVRGQGLLCLILALFYGVSLTLIGLNFGLMIGLFAGLISFVPYIGTILGFVVAVSVALVQFWPDGIWVAVVAGIFVFGNFMEGNVLQPKLVGSHVGLHPVWLIFALFAFGYLFGFVGMLLAVPLAAALGVLSRFVLDQYLGSAIYRGSGGEGPGQPQP